MENDVIHDRRFVLGVSIVALVPAFALTYMLVSRYKDQRQQLAEEWSARGERAVAHDPSLAVVDFQTALSYGDREGDRLRLAESLIAAKRSAEARAELLTLWAGQPGNGKINLDLARLAAVDGDVTDAVRYYHAAVDGAWSEDEGPSVRRTARLELAKLLLSKGQDIRAQAELIALIDNLPSEPAVITDLGSLLVDAGADSRALGLFQRALSLNPSEARAARLAGGVAFRAGNYRLAHQYLAEAAKETALDQETRSMLDVSERVLALDPSLPGLGAQDRALHVLQALGVAHARLAHCEGESASALAARVDASARLASRALERDADLSDQTMSLVFDVEALPSSVCGPGSTDDQALQLIAGQRRAQPR